MKQTLKRLVLPALALACALPLAAQNGAEKTFAVTLPQGFGEFTTQSQKSDSPEGIVETTNWISRAPSGEAVVVTVSKMPAKITNPDKLITSTRDSLLKSLSATLDLEKKIEGETSTTLLQFHSEKSPVFVQSQLMVEGDRLYQLLYVGRTAEQRSAPTVSNLFNSFKIAQ
jgi:hypothetical protein